MKSLLVGLEFLKEIYWVQISHSPIIKLLKKIIEKKIDNRVGRFRSPTYTIIQKKKKKKLWLKN